MQMNRPLTITEASCADDYDPNSMPVAKARAFIHTFLSPLKGFTRLPIRSALGRVLSEDITSPVNVPAHVNSAMDGWAIRFEDLANDATAVFTEVVPALPDNLSAARLTKANACVFLPAAWYRRGAMRS